MKRLAREYGDESLASAIEAEVAEIFADEDEDEDHRYNPAPFCGKCSGPCMY